MANTISPNMSLPIPTVGTQPGPDYAENVNSSLTLIDQHDHTPGNGLIIPSAGIGINADLTFGGYAASNLRAAIFDTEASVADVQSIYVLGVDLYYRDGNNNQVRLTQSGSIVGTAGSITGLPSGTAGVSYSSGIFTFSAATNTPANLQVGSILLGNNSALSKYLTLAPPSAMASDYSITLPALPASTKILQMSSSGVITAALAVDGLTLQNSGNALSIKDTGVGTNQLATGSVTSDKLASASVSTAKIIDANVTRAKLAAVGQQAGSTINFTTFSTTYTAVTNGSISLTTTGRPVMAILNPIVDVSSGNTPGYLVGDDFFDVAIFLNGVIYKAVRIQAATTNYPGSIVFLMNPVAASTYTIAVYTRTNPAGGGGSVEFHNMNFTCYEL